MLSEKRRDFVKEVVYSNGSSKTEIEFDGDYYSITQVVHGISAQTIVVSKQEIEKMFDFTRKEN